jgi:hypothetical protein
LSLAGTGALAIWNDIAPEGREVFFEWHGREHVAERLAIPGFLRCRRYVALYGAPEHFTFYETTNLEVLTGPGYSGAMGHQTPWTAEAVSHLRNLDRHLCAVVASTGEHDGGLMACWRYTLPTSATSQHARDFDQLILPKLAGKQGVGAVHLLANHGNVHPAEAAKGAAAPAATSHWIILAEGWDDIAPFEALCRSVLSSDDAKRLGMTAPVQHGLYRLMLSSKT